MHPNLRELLDKLGRNKLPTGISAIVLRSGLVRFRVSEPSGERGRAGWSPLLDTLQDAEDYRAAYLRRLKEADLQRDTLTLGQAVDVAVTRMRQAGLRAGTIEWFDECSRVWLPFFGQDRMPAEILPSEVAEFVAQRRRKVSGSSVLHYRRSLAMLKKYAGFDLLRGVDPTVWPRVERREATFFPLERIRQAIEQIRSRPHPLARHDADVVALLAATGLRRSEAARLRVRDADLQERRLWIQGKSRNEYVTLSDGAAESVRRLIERTAGESGDADRAVIPGGADAIVRVFKRAASVVKEPGFTAHAMRHSLVAALFATGADVAQVRKLSRHSTISALDRYVHTSKADLNALNAVDPLGTSKAKAGRTNKARAKAVRPLRVVG